MRIYLEFEAISPPGPVNAWVVCTPLFKPSSLCYDVRRDGWDNGPGLVNPGAPHVLGTCALNPPGFILSLAVDGFPPGRPNKRFSFDVDPDPGETSLRFNFGVYSPKPGPWTFGVQVDSGPTLTHTLDFDGNLADPSAPKTTEQYNFDVVLSIPALTIIPSP